MSMLEKFFSVEYAGREDLFEGLSIWKDEEYCKIQGTYPVISLSFANVKERDYVSTVQRINQVITELYNDARFLLEGDLLSKFLYSYYGKRVIILLDEYWDELVSFTRSMLNAAFKTNPYLERAIMTGITRVSTPKASLGKESIFSDLNNLEVITTTSGKYEDAFGFTEEEVFAALDEFEFNVPKYGAAMVCWNR